MSFETIYESVVNSFKDMDNQQEKTLNKVKEKLKKRHDISPGITVSLLTRDINEVLETEDVRLPRLFVKEVLEISNQKDKINEIFTKSEVKELEQFLYSNESKDFSLPLELFPTLKLNELTFSVKMSAKMIAQMFESQVFNYNFDIQRESQRRKRKDSIIAVPKINQTNIKEMRDLLLKGQLKDSTIYFNAAPRTSEQGDELIMDEANHTITITKGTRLDILDGYHRCLASQAAYLVDPTIDFNFNVVLSNYTTKEAQLWQAQHAKAMPWSGHRVKELQQENRSDKVVSALRATPEIGEYIGASSRLYKNQLTSFSTLSDAIDRSFDIKNRRDEVEIVEYLAEYMDELVQYDIDWNTPRKDNMITSSMGTYGIVYFLAKCKEDMNVSKFYTFLDKYSIMSSELKQQGETDSLNRPTVSNKHYNGIVKLVDEVIENVQ